MLLPLQVAQRKIRDSSALRGRRISSILGDGAGTREKAGGGILFPQEYSSIYIKMKVRLRTRPDGSRTLHRCMSFLVHLTVPTALYHHQELLLIHTPWSTVLLEKLASLQLVKKFPAFYGTRRFLTALYIYIYIKDRSDKKTRKKA